MRVAYASHALVATRQVLFADELRRQLQTKGGDLLELYPTMWGNHTRQGGYYVTHPGDMMHYDYPEAAYANLVRWNPDVILIQNEAYCQATRHLAAWCQRQKTPYVCFHWENAVPPDVDSVKVMNLAAANVFGNSDALHLAESQGYDSRAPHQRLPQVGIDSSLFQPIWGLPKEFNILFAGRHTDPMKGLSILEAAVAEQSWRLRITGLEPYTTYADLPKKYRTAQVLAVPSIDVPNRPREQFAPAVAIESLMTGTPVVASTQAAVQEWLTGCPAVTFHEMGDATDLREKLRAVIDGPGKFLGQQGRTWAEERFSNEAVAKEYVDVFEDVAA